ncbi:MAG: Thiol-disulfide oxidoreductase ResA [Bryobacteraceae bacterium]|nr:Thiol-disulfide oxidoreductase ResA [Bryobacteraceae bacterium]
MRRAFLSICALLVCLPLAAQSGNTPRHAPPLEIAMPDGTKVNLSRCAGKVCVVEFLFTTCPHCQETSQVMSKLYSEYGARGFQPLGAAFNENAMLLVPEFVRNNNVNYPVGVLPREKVLDYLGYSMMARLMVPQVVFIDRKGTIRYQSSIDGGENLHSEARMRQIIEELLKEPAGSRKTVSMKKK